jgi:hypothetical protein
VWKAFMKNGIHVWCTCGSISARDKNNCTDNEAEKMLEKKNIYVDF